MRFGSPILSEPIEVILSVDSLCLQGAALLSSVGAIFFALMHWGSKRQVMSSATAQ